MNALRVVFERAKQENRAALITYLMAGDPSVPDSLEYFKACAQGGADVLEVGFPFSDPIADGPTIAAAATRALQSKTSLQSVFELCGELKSATKKPLVMMGYVNPVLSFGVDAFFAAMAHGGVDTGER
jgi:tryptophan synthase alpha chain